jgi:hypothetical protein
MQYLQRKTVKKKDSMLKLAMKHSDATIRMIQNHEDKTAEPKDIHILSMTSLFGY